MPNAQFPVHPEQSSRISSLHGVRIREDVLFSNHMGVENPGIRKREEKIIEGLSEVLTKVLGPEEVVLAAIRCQAPLGALEQFTLGWYVYYVTQAVLVFTNQRLMCYQVKQAGSFGKGVIWKQGLRSANWGDIEEAKVKGWLIPTLNLKFRDGRKERFSGLGFGNARKIKILLSAIQTAGSAPATSAQGMPSLCPSCFAELSPEIYTCGKCRLEFKNEKTLLKMLFIPGGDYFYVGLRYLGVVHFISGSVLLVMLVLFGLAAFGVADFLAEPGHPSAPSEVLPGLAFLALIFASHKALTFLSCRRMVRRFIPLK